MTAPLTSALQHLTRTGIDILQVNMGKRCNQACTHCHVEASPAHTEEISQETVERLLVLLRNCPECHTLDITGGAPELCSSFRYLVQEGRALGKEVIVRCNLTVLHEEGQENTAEFYRDNGVRLVCSLPCYEKENVDKQRGRGVFDKSIASLRLLNALGFGTGGELQLDLVYNPGGAFLPPEQSVLEDAYRRELKQRYGISFSSLFTITNMAVNRFRDDLERKGELETYEALLEENYNPDTLDNLMCRSLISVNWQGELFDCDFNQMLCLPAGNTSVSLRDISSLHELVGRRICTARHCLACTAGVGSSCQGSLVAEENCS